MLGIWNHYSVIELSPSTHFFNDVSDSSLFCPSLFLSRDWATLNLLCPIFLVGWNVFIIIFFLTNFSDTLSFPLCVGILIFGYILSTTIFIWIIRVFWYIIFDILFVLWTHFDLLIIILVVFNYSVFDLLLLLIIIFIQVLGLLGLFISITRWIKLFWLVFHVPSVVLVFLFCFWYSLLQKIKMIESVYLNDI